MRICRPNETVEVDVEAIDKLGRWSVRSFRLTVISNTPPRFEHTATSLGSLYDSSRGAAGLASLIPIAAADSEQEAVELSYLIVSGALPPGIAYSLTSGVLSGEADAVTADTTHTFTMQVFDGFAKVEREFSITIKAPIFESFSLTCGTDLCEPTDYSNVWTSPLSGDIQVLVVGAGGGNGVSGGGAVVHHRAFPVVAGKQYPYEIGIVRSGNNGKSSVWAGTALGTLPDRPDTITALGDKPVAGRAGSPTEPVGLAANTARASAAK